MQFKKTRERHSEKDGMLKVFAGSAVKYISGDYLGTTAAALQDSAIKRWLAFALQ